MIESIIEWPGWSWAGWGAVAALMAVAAIVSKVRHDRESRPHVTTRNSGVYSEIEWVPNSRHRLDGFGRPILVGGYTTKSILALTVFNTGGSAVTISAIHVTFPFRGKSSLVNPTFEVHRRVAARDDTEFSLLVSDNLDWLLVSPLPLMDYALSSWRNLRITFDLADGSSSTQTLSWTGQQLIRKAGQRHAVMRAAQRK